jgi:hypothetical protein
MSLLGSASKQLVILLYQVIQVPIYLYQYLMNILIISHCVLTMIMIESYMHICGDRSDKCQNWQWKLMQVIFVKSKKNNRQRIQLKSNSTGSRGFRRLVTILSAGHQLLAMSNIINKPSVELEDMGKNMCGTDSFAFKSNNCCTQTMSGYQSDCVESTMKSITGQQVVGFGKT